MEINQMMMMQCEDVMELLHVRKSKAYNIIKEAGNELKIQGYRIIQGRVPARYIIMKYRKGDMQ